MVEPFRPISPSGSSIDSSEALENALKQGSSSEMDTSEASREHKRAQRAITKKRQGGPTFRQWSLEKVKAGQEEQDQDTLFNALGREADSMERQAENADGGSRTSVHAGGTMATEINDTMVAEINRLMDQLSETRKDAEYQYQQNASLRNLARQDRKVFSASKNRQRTLSKSLQTKPNNKGREKIS